MKLFSFGKPTVAQLKHDAWVIATTFIAAFVTAWQIQPDKFTKSAVIAAAAAGFAAVITTGKSFLTNL